MGPVGITGSITVGVAVSFDYNTFNVTGYGIYGKLSLGGSIGSGAVRVGIASGIGHGNLDSYEGWGLNGGLFAPDWLAGGFELSVPNDWQDADGNLLFDVSGALSGNKALNKDIGVGYFGYIDLSKTGYFKRTDTLAEMIDWLKGEDARNTIPQPSPL